MKQPKIVIVGGNVAGLIAANACGVDKHAERGGPECTHMSVKERKKRGIGRLPASLGEALMKWRKILYSKSYKEE